MAALIQAAQNGKQVTVLVELKARFDEANNLLRADQLINAGVHVIYGVKNFKTHAKICMIVRREETGLRRYLHLGTGNYNESTAKIYTDISYLTADPTYGEDASLFFNVVTGRSKIMNFQKFAPAPTYMKSTLVANIESEAQRAAAGEMARIRAKVNSLQDADIIEALHKAAEAGVEIQLCVRGICCFASDLPNVQVVSIIDRLLEHSRVFSFYQGGDELVYFASADWMVRNLEKRVELMVPVEDELSKAKLLDLLDASFKDNVNAYALLPDGSSQLLESEGKSFRSQAFPL